MRISRLVGPFRLLVPFIVAGVHAAAPFPLEAQHPGELRGRVVDAATGQGIPAAAVFVPAMGVREGTDGHGAVHLRGLAPGETEVVAERFGYRPGRVTVVVRNGTVTRFELSLVPEALPAPGVRVEADRAGATVLDAEAIRAAGARTTGELLANLPGVTLVRRGAGGPEEVRLRGGDADHVLVLVDGVALNDPMTGAADLSSLPADGIVRIEVLPGARTARYGAGALAGVVLIESRASRGERAEAALWAGDLGERGISTFAQGRAGPLTVSAGGSLRRVRGTFPFELDSSLGGGTELRRNADVAERGLRLDAGGAAGASLWEVGLRTERLERGIPGKSFAPSDSARQDLAGSTATLRWTRRAPRGTVGAHVHHRRREVHFRDPAPPLGPAFDDRTRLAETGATLRGEVSTASPETLVGAELSVNRQRIRGGAIVGGPARAVDGAVAIHGQVGDPDLPFSPAVHVAARLHRDGRTADWLPAHEITLRGRAVRGSGTLGAHATWRSSFSPPSAGDLYFREGVGIAPNPDLRPERVPRELELGASAAFPVGSTTVRLAGEMFVGDLEDMIVWTPDFRFTWSPRNVDVHRRGGEVRASLRDPGSGLEASGHVSSTRATYAGGGGTPGVQVVYRPRDMAGWALGWRREGWHGRLQGRYTGLRYPVRAAANALDPFWTFELTAGGRIHAAGWAVEPLLRIDRLFDERAPFIHAVPEPGRTVRFELRIAPPVPFSLPSDMEPTR